MLSLSRLDGLPINAVIGVEFSLQGHKDSTKCGILRKRFAPRPTIDLVHERSLCASAAQRVIVAFSFAHLFLYPSIYPSLFSSHSERWPTP